MLLLLDVRQIIVLIGLFSIKHKQCIPNEKRDHRRPRRRWHLDLKSGGPQGVERSLSEVSWNSRLRDRRTCLSQSEVSEHLNTLTRHIHTQSLYPSPRTCLLNKELPTCCTFEFGQVFLVNLIMGLWELPAVTLRLVRSVVVIPVHSFCLLGIKPEPLLVVWLRRHFRHFSSLKLHYYEGIRQNPSTIHPLR